MAYGGKGPPDTKGGLHFVTAVSDRDVRDRTRFRPTAQARTFLVTGLVLLSLPTVAKGFVSEDASSILCSPLSAFWSLSCSLSVHGQRELMTIEPTNTIVTDMVSPVSLMEEATRNLSEQRNLAVGPLSAFSSSSTGPVVQRIALAKVVLTSTCSHL